VLSGAVSTEPKAGAHIARGGTAEVVINRRRFSTYQIHSIIQGPIKALCRCHNIGDNSMLVNWRFVAMSKGFRSNYYFNWRSPNGIVCIAGDYNYQLSYTVCFTWESPPPDFPAQMPLFIKSLFNQFSFILPTIWESKSSYWVLYETETNCQILLDRIALLLWLLWLCNCIMYIKAGIAPTCT